MKRSRIDSSCAGILLLMPLLLLAGCGGVLLYDRESHTQGLIAR